MLDTRENTPSLFTVRFSERVLIKDLTFTDNWLDSGAISVFVKKEYLPW